MKKSYTIPASVAEKLVRHQLNLGDEPIELTPASTGRFSTTYFVKTLAATSEYVIRISPPDDLLMLFYERRMMRQEPELHQKIQAATQIPIPTILAYDFTRERIDRDYLIMNRMPGKSLAEMRGQLSSTQLEKIFRQWGELIAQLHSIKSSQYGYLGAHRPMPPQDRWDEAFEIMWSKMLDDCVNCGIYQDSDRKLGLKLWQLHRQAFDPHCPSVLCHMDLWVENVLVDATGQVTCLFDFDRACFGDAENEFAVGEYCGVTTEAFWEGYGSRFPMTREAAIRRWFYLLYEHQKYIIIRVSERHNDQPTARRYANECLRSMHHFLSTGQPYF